MTKMRNTADDCKLCEAGDGTHMHPRHRPGEVVRAQLLERASRDDDPVPRVWRLLLAIVLLGLLCTAAFAVVSWAAQLRDDVRMTRERVEQCR